MYDVHFSPTAVSQVDMQALELTGASLRAFLDERATIRRIHTKVFKVGEQ